MFAELTINDTLLHQDAHIRLQSPVVGYTSAAFSRVRAACGELEPLLSTQARVEDRCSPLTTDPNGFAAHVLNPDPWFDRLHRLALASAVVARGIAASDFEGSVRLLLQSIATIRDLGSGAVPMNAAHAAVRAEFVLLSTLQTLLLTERSLEPLALARLDAAFEALIEDPVEDYALALGESVALSDFYVTGAPNMETEELDLIQRLAGHRLPRLVADRCGREGVFADCLDRTPTPSPPRRGLLQLLLGERATRGAFVERAFDYLIDDLSFGVSRLMEFRASLRMLRVVLHLSLGRNGHECPTLADLPEEWLQTPRGHLVLGAVGQLHSLADTGGLQGPHHRRVEVLFACPAFAGRATFAGGRAGDGDEGDGDGSMAAAAE